MSPIIISVTSQDTAIWPNYLHLQCTKIANLLHFIFTWHKDCQFVPFLFWKTNKEIFKPRSRLNNLSFFFCINWINWIVLLYPICPGLLEHMNICPYISRGWVRLGIQFFLEMLTVIQIKLKKIHEVWMPITLQKLLGPKGRVTVLKRMNFRESSKGRGAFSIQKFMLQILDL